MSSRRADYAMGAAIFAASGVALGIGDLFVSTIEEERLVASWALMKSVAIILPTLVLSGLDQAIARRAVDLTDVSVFGARRVAVGIVAGGVVALWSSPYEPFPQTLVFASLVGIAAGSATGLQLLGGVQRSQLRVRDSLVALHGWKGVVGIGIIAVLTLGPRIDLAIEATSAGVMVVIVWLVYWRAQVTGMEPRTEGLGPSTMPTQALAHRFWLLSVVLAALSYGDQVLLNVTGATEASAKYFTIYAVAVLPVAFVAAFGGSVANPLIRELGDRIRRKRNLVWVGLIAVVVAAAIGALVLVRLGTLLHPNWPHDLPTMTVAGIAAIGVSRLAYLLPSGIVGIFGTYRDLDISIAAGLSAGVLMTVTYLGGVYVLRFDPLSAMVIGVNLALILRVGVGLVVVHRILGQSVTLTIPNFFDGEEPSSI